MPKDYALRKFGDSGNVCTAAQNSHNRWTLEKSHLYDVGILAAAPVDESGVIDGILQLASSDGFYA